MFQNLLVAPLGNTSEVHDWHNRPFTTLWPEPQSHRIKRKGTDPEITKTIKRKPKRNRTAFTTEQLRGLEESFAACRYIEADGRRKLADTLKVGDKAIKVWFQNRRMKEKREESERDVDSCSSATGISASDTPPLHSPASQMEFQHFNTENPAPYATDQPLITEMSPGYCVGTDYASNFQDHYQEPNKISCYNHGYYNFEAQQHSYNVQDTFSASSGCASFAYDGNGYPTHYYPYHDYFEGSTHQNHQAFYGDQYLSL